MADSVRFPPLIISPLNDGKGSMTHEFIRLRAGSNCHKVQSINEPAVNDLLNLLCYLILLLRIPS